MSALLADLAAMYRWRDQRIRSLMAEFDEQELLVCPHPGSNCAYWLIGHVAWARGVLLGLLGLEVTGRSWEDLFRTQSSPVSSITVPIAEVLETLFERGRRIAEALPRLSAEKLEEEIGFALPQGAATVTALLNYNASFHESYHLGQLGLIGRALGKTPFIGGSA